MPYFAGEKVPDDDEDQQDFKEALETPDPETQDGLEMPLSEVQNTEEKTEAEVCLREAHPCACTSPAPKPKTQSIWKGVKGLEQVQGVTVCSSHSLLRLRVQQLLQESIIPEHAELKAAHAAFQKGEWKDVKKHCQAALQTDPLSLDAQLLKVEADFRMGCFKMVANTYGMIMTRLSEFSSDDR